MAERRAALNRPFRATLDRLGITHDPIERGRVGRAIQALTKSSLPAPEDYETLIYPVGTAWVRALPPPGRALWLVYRFDANEVTTHALVDRRPVRVGD